MIYQVVRESRVGRGEETIGMVATVKKAKALVRADEKADRADGVINSYSLTTWRVYAWELGAAKPAQEWTIFCRELEQRDDGEWRSDL